MSEKTEKEKFIELPLCEIIAKYGHLPGGEQFVKDLQTSWSLRLCLHILSKDNIFVCMIYARPSGETPPANGRSQLADLQSL